MPRFHFSPVPLCRPSASAFASGCGNGASIPFGWGGGRLGWRQIVKKFTRFLRRPAAHSRGNNPNNADAAVNDGSHNIAFSHRRRWFGDAGTVYANFPRCDKAACERPSFYKAREPQPFIETLRLNRHDLLDNSFAEPFSRSSLSFARAANGEFGSIGFSCFDFLAGLDLAVLCGRSSSLRFARAGFAGFLWDDLRTCLVSLSKRLRRLGRQISS